MIVPRTELGERGREVREEPQAGVILSEAKEAMSKHGLLRFAQDDTDRNHPIVASSRSSAA
jgi:hypothetical protein